MTSLVEGLDRELEEEVSLEVDKGDGGAGAAERPRAGLARSGVKTRLFAPLFVLCEL